MKTISMPVLLTSVGISFALGFGFAWHMLASDDPSATPPHAATSAPPANNQLADLWNKTGPSSGDAQAYAGSSAPTAASGAQIDEQKMRLHAESDPSYLRNLIQRYESERNPEMKEAIKSVLATVQKPEALAFFTRLANSGDPAKRKEGYAMLQQMAPDSPELRNVLKQALAGEQSPEILAQAIAALRPTVVDPAESSAIVSQLTGLTQHADPAVRSQSVLQLAQWDKSGANQERLTQALADPAPEVRQSAIFAIAQSGTRSTQAKSALLDMINSPAETKEVKSSALQVLERFSLSSEEYARYAQMRAQLGS